MLLSKDQPLGKRMVAFLTLAIMLTCGLTNAGFILLLIADNDEFSELAWDAWETIVGCVCAALGGSFSGYAQKSIYLKSLDDLGRIISQGELLKDIKGKTIDLYGLKIPAKMILFCIALLCALCSFLVNYGMATLGIGVLIGSGTPILLGGLAVLFALANSLLVFYTALDALKKGETLPECLKQSKMLGVVLSVLFAAIAAWGLVMTFYPGITQIIGKHAEELNGQIAFGIILGLALLTEVFYSFTKACHLAYMFTAQKFPSRWTMAAIVTNAVIASTAGIDGGLKFGEDLDVKEDSNTETAVISPAGFAAGGWSMTCSGDTPDNKPLIVNQFKMFQEKAAKKNNPATPAPSWRSCFSY
jgi:hypothetical protein